MARKPQRHVIKPVFHPSGRPRRDDRVVSSGYFRGPPDEPLTPGLRPGRAQTYAIGFTANIAPDDFDDD